MRLMSCLKHDGMGKLLSINLLQRVIVALAGIPLLLWLIKLGGVFFFGFFLVLALLAVFEFHRFARHKATPLRYGLFC